MTWNIARYFQQRGAKKIFYCLLYGCNLATRRRSSSLNVSHSFEWAKNKCVMNPSDSFSILISKPKSVKVSGSIFIRVRPSSFLIALFCFKFQSFRLVSSNCWPCSRMMVWTCLAFKPDWKRRSIPPSWDSEMRVWIGWAVLAVEGSWIYSLHVIVKDQVPSVIGRRLLMWTLNSLLNSLNHDAWL